MMERAKKNNQRCFFSLSSFFSSFRNSVTLFGHSRALLTKSMAEIEVKRPLCVPNDDKKVSNESQKAKKVRKYSTCCRTSGPFRLATSEIIPISNKQLGNWGEFVTHRFSVFGAKSIMSGARRKTRSNSWLTRKSPRSKSKTLAF